MKLIIVRHAEPDYSIDSLTEKGFIEAELLSERLSKLDIDAFYCSPLGRAQDTSKPTLKKMNRVAQTLPWLREFLGNSIEADGTESYAWDRLPGVWTQYPEHYDPNNWYNSPLYKNSNVKEHYDTVAKGVDELLEKHGYKKEGGFYRAVNPNTDTIVLFCHFAVECVILSHIWNISPMVLWHGTVALPSSVTTLITEERVEGEAYFRMNGFADLSHLYAADHPASFAARFCEVYSDFSQRH